MCICSHKGVYLFFCAVVLHYRIGEERNTEEHNFYNIRAFFLHITNWKFWMLTGSFNKKIAEKKPHQIFQAVIKFCDSTGVINHFPKP